MENENKEFMPVQEDELEELHQRVKDSDAIRHMLNTTGWSEVMKPGIDRALDEQLRAIEKAETLQDFIFAQQTIKAVKGLMDCAKLAIALGEDARERIRLTNEHRPDGKTQD